MSQAELTTKNMSKGGLEVDGIKRLELAGIRGPGNWPVKNLPGMPEGRVAGVGL